MASQGSAQGRTTALERASVAGRVVLAAGGGYGIAALATADIHIQNLLLVPL